MQSLSVIQCISLFKNEFIFSKQSDNTRRLYVRSVDLFGLFLMLYGLKAPGDEIDTALPIANEKYLMDYGGIPGIRLRTRISKEARDTIEKINFINLHSIKLIDLDAVIYPKFVAWLHLPTRNNGKGLSDITIKTYLAGIRTAFGFWRVRKQLKFMSEEQEDLLKHSRVASKKIINDPARKSRMVPPDFGTKMLEGVYKMPLTDKSEDSSSRVERLRTLRARALIWALFSSGQRVSDVTALLREDLTEAKKGNLIEKQNIKTGRRAHFLLGQEAVEAINAYLAERNDTSPYLFIQHGRWGTPPKSASPYYFMQEGKTRGYGVKLSTKTARDITKKVAEYAGYIENGKNNAGVHVSPHAFRHYHLTKLKEMGLSLDVIQDVAGHASIETTKSIYASKVDRNKIIEVEKKLQNLNRTKVEPKAEENL